MPERGAGSAILKRKYDWERVYSLSYIRSGSFAELCLTARYITHIVQDLVEQTEISPVRCEELASREARYFARQTGHFEQARGFLLDDSKIFGFGDFQVADVRRFFEL